MVGALEVSGYLGIRDWNGVEQPNLVVLPLLGTGLSL